MTSIKGVGSLHILIPGILLLSSPPAMSKEELLLVNNGEPRCAVVLAPTAADDVRFAVDDLVRCVEVMSGARLQVYEDEEQVPADLAPILIGRDADHPFLDSAGTDQAFVLAVSADQVVISGPRPSSSGTMFGIYEFLHDLGVRWFMPGELGEVIPQRRTVTVPVTKKQEAPDFVGRRIQYSGHYPTGGATEIWERRVKLRPTPGIPGSHAFHKWIPKEKYFEEHPEYFALVNGHRQPPQLCTSNPAVLRVFCENILTRYRGNPPEVIPIGPSDGRGFCECDGCRALDAGDWDPNYNQESVTDRMIVFFNQVAERLGTEFPDTRYSFYIYVTHRRPPVRERPDPRLIGMLAPIKLCVIHGTNQRQCPQRSVAWPHLVRSWTSLPLEIWNRDYGSILYGGAYFPLSLAHRWRAEIPLCHKLGVKGFRVETWVSWAGQMLDPYLLARLWWDAETDVDALIDDYFNKLYGPAAEPMQRYWQLIDDATASTPYHAIALSSLNLKHWYSPEVVEAGAEDLALAARLAGTDVQRERIELIRLSHNALQNFRQMSDDMEAGKFGQAAAAYQRIHDVYEAGSEILQGDPPFADFYAFVHLYQDWDQSCQTWENVPHFSKVAAERTTGANELVTLLPKTWWTQTDPLNVGQEHQWYQPKIFSPVDWIKRDTHTSARNQGLGDYFGKLWYRSTVKIPERLHGRKIMLYFAGLRDGDVWINGDLIGEVQRHQPRELDVSQAVVFGADNTIVVRTDDHGIYRPSFLWSPR